MRGDCGLYVSSAHGRKTGEHTPGQSTADPRRSAANAATSTASRPAGHARSTGRRRVWQMTGAELAIATLVGGTAVPAIGMAGGSGAVATDASADLRTQSFTASAKVLPEVVVSGEFSATTPEELVELPSSPPRPPAAVSPRSPSPDRSSSRWQRAPTR